MPGLEHHRVNLVPPPEISRCAFCGTDYREGLSFVSYDNNVDSEPVPAGLIETVDKRLGRHIYTARDAFGRGSHTATLELPQVCSECLTQGAALLGLEDITPLRAELDEARAELARVQAERDHAVTEREDADQAVRALRAFERIGGEPPKKPRAKGAA